MQCYDTLTPISASARGTAVALGYFDGVHLGHRSVLCATQKAAQSRELADAVFTFTLPAAATSHGLAAQKGQAILTQTEKRRRMQACGVQHYFCPSFEAFCGFSPTRFVDEILVHCLGARVVLCGANFTFGANKSGDVATLRRLCAACGIEVCVVDMAQYQGESVSSSRIRAALMQGDIAAANAMLGEAYRIDFLVQHGKQLGRTLGFPTINQAYPAGMLVPQQGVYLTRAKVTDEQGAVRWLPAATGLGTRPTVTAGEPDPKTTCETFIAQYAGELYGARVSVEFHSFWNPTQRFDTLDALKEYIGQAAAAAQACFA